jgi:hypothetical protein
MTKNLLAILLGVLVSMLAPPILEGGVRLLRTDINHHDTERALFLERAFGSACNPRFGRAGANASPPGFSC